MLLRVRSDNGNLYFEALQNGQVVSKDGNASGGLVFKNGRFKVSGISSPVLDVLKKIPKMLDLEQKHILSYPQNETILKKLIEAWPSIMVPVACTSELDSVLNDPMKPQVRLSLREDEHWVNYSLGWEIGEHRLSNEEMQHAVEAKSSLYRSRGGNWLNLDLDAVSETLIELKWQTSLSPWASLEMEAKNFLSKLDDKVSIPASSDKLVQKTKSVRRSCPTDYSS